MADRIGQDAASWDVAPSIDLLRNVVASGKQAIIWGFGYFADALGKCQAPLLWDKQTGDNYFADGELAWTSFTTGTLRIFRHQWCGCFKASERGIKAEHPTQKPVALMAWCLERAKVSVGASVLDPFMGSGTTLVACELAGMAGTGIEISTEYFDVACRRVEAAVKQREAEQAQLSLTV
jgi:site-specific DNA-methyltransferase (adenine-specific)/modification methylase